MHNQSEAQNPSAIKPPISQQALDQLFREARTHSTWLPEPVPIELLRKAYELTRLGPTSANGSPARFVFLTTPGAKALLKPALAPGNVDKSMAAPVTVIIAWDTEFHSIFRGFFHRLTCGRTLSGINLSLRKTPSETVHCKPHTSSLPHALWD
jgi:3-hydroxypropanoate dehydrogenase